MLALTAYVGQQSRGMPVNRPTNACGPSSRQAATSSIGGKARSTSPARNATTSAGENVWPGSVIPQGHATGYPLYRLEWQTLGSLQRRLRNCLTGMRAELYPPGAPEYVDLQLYLMWRARGLAVETPAVRP